MMRSSLVSRNFGFLPGGESVEAWVLHGLGGLTVEAITYGATVTRLLALDRNGHMDDVVLGFSSLDPYLAHRACFGATIGRVAGRIANGRFSLDGVDYELACNAAPNHLHGGGVEGFDKKIWSASAVDRADGAPSLQMKYFSPHGENGYPGNVEIAVTFTVTSDNVLLIDTESSTDQQTPLSLTHHSYFNLAGEASGSSPFQDAVTTFASRGRLGGQSRIYSKTTAICIQFAKR